MGQLYHRFFRVNELAGGRLTLPDRVIDLSAVHVPVLSIAGADDVLAPPAAVHHVARLLPNATRVHLVPGSRRPGAACPAGAAGTAAGGADGLLRPAPRVLAGRASAGARPPDLPGPGGHLGVLTGRAARHTTWAWLDAFPGDAAPVPTQRPLRVLA